MRSVRERTDILLERIHEQQRLTRKTLQDVEENALHLQDGRAVYVGQKGEYLDGQGYHLQGDDKSEADALHRQNPDPSTWSQKDDVQRQYEEQQRLKDKVQRLHDDAKGNDGETISDKARGEKAVDAKGRLSEVEREFSRQVEKGNAALPSEAEITDETYGGSDYMAAYGRTKSYAASLETSQNKTVTPVSNRRLQGGDSAGR